MLERMAARMVFFKRFWDKVDKTSGCWEWRGSASGNGYGRISINYTYYSAHRLAYSIMCGPIPNGMCVCHHCDNKLCVNPGHLFLGTSSDNQRDSVTKGRNADFRGENAPLSKLTNNDVHEIRRLHSLGVKQILIAKMWKIGRSNTNLIVKRNTWKHI